MFYVFSRKVNSGKTTELSYLQSKMMNKIKLCSFLSFKKRSGKKRIYYLDYNGIRISKVVEVIHGKLFWHQNVFDFAHQIIKTQRFDFYIIDEVGHIELKKNGFYKSIKYLKKNKKNIVLCVRDYLVNEVVSFLKTKDYLIVNSINEITKKYVKN